MLLVLVAKAKSMLSSTTLCELSPYLSKLINEFKDVSLDDFPTELTSSKDIQYAIDLVLGLPLPNLPHFRMNPSEHEEVNRQIEGLL